MFVDGQVDEGAVGVAERESVSFARGLVNGFILVAPFWVVVGGLVVWLVR